MCKRGSREAQADHFYNQEPQTVVSQQGISRRHLGGRSCGWKCVRTVSVNASLSGGG